MKTFFLLLDGLAAAILAGLFAYALLYKPFWDYNVPFFDNWGYLISLVPAAYALRKSASNLGQMNGKQRSRAITDILAWSVVLGIAMTGGLFAIMFGFDPISQVLFVVTPFAAIGLILQAISIQPRQNT